MSSQLALSKKSAYLDVIILVYNGQKWYTWQYHLCCKFWLVCNFFILFCIVPMFSPDLLFYYFCLQSKFYFYYKYFSFITLKSMGYIEYILEYRFARYPTKFFSRRFIIGMLNLKLKVI